MVCAIASGVNLVRNVGKCLSRSVVKKRSSPRDSRFFLCSVSTFGSEYSSMMRFEMMTGRPLSAVRILYMEKQPGRQVTEPKRLSNAFERWWEM